MKHLYWIVGMRPTRSGHIEESVPGVEPTPNKREAIKRGRQFLHTDASLTYSHLWVVRIEETAAETGVAVIK